MKQDKKESNKRSIGARVIICALILAVSILGFVGLKSLKEPPVKNEKKERALKVATMTATRNSVPVSLIGHGELTSIRTVTLAAAVAGTITETHPRLKAGEVINKGELLFAIDDADYLIDYEINRERLQILEKDLTLARKELSRVNELFNKNKVGSVSGLESAEKTVNSAADRLAQVRQAMTRAKINLDRCHVVAPFTCRIISSKVEAGQYVTKGKTIATIADDSLLEVELPIYGKEAVEWLTFKELTETNNNWFGQLEKSPSKIRWTENPSTVFEGSLHRISTYSANTRSMNIVVRLDNSSPNKTSSFPLVAGMFVSVEIPGRNMENVIEIPRAAVSFENTVYQIRDDRLYTTVVEVVRIQGDHAYIGSGLEEGEEVVITRLINPLEGSLIQRIMEPSEAK